jgi:hypothetical protein
MSRTHTHTSALYFDGEVFRDKATDEVVIVPSDEVKAREDRPLKATPKLSSRCIPKASPRTAETFFVGDEKCQTAVVVERRNVKSPTLAAAIAKARKAAQR